MGFIISNISLYLYVSSSHEVFIHVNVVCASDFVFFIVRVSGGRQGMRKERKTESEKKKGISTRVSQYYDCCKLKHKTRNGTFFFPARHLAFVFPFPYLFFPGTLNTPCLLYGSACPLLRFPLPFSSRPLQYDKLHFEVQVRVPQVTLKSEAQRRRRWLLHNRSSRSVAHIHSTSLTLCQP